MSPFSRRSGRLSLWWPGGSWKNTGEERAWLDVYPADGCGAAVCGPLVTVPLDTAPLELLVADGQVIVATPVGLRVFGLAYRSEATDALWKSAGQQVVAAWPDDRSVRGVADEHGVAIALLKHLPDIDLYTGQQ